MLVRTNELVQRCKAIRQFNRSFCPSCAILHSFPADRVKSRPLVMLATVAQSQPGQASIRQLPGAALSGLVYLLFLEPVCRMRGLPWAEALLL